MYVHIMCVFDVFGCFGVINDNNNAPTQQMSKG